MELIKKICKTCGLPDGIVRFCENRKECNICRRKTKNINPDYNHEYYLLNKQANQYIPYLVRYSFYGIYFR